MNGNRKIQCSGVEQHVVCRASLPGMTSCRSWEEVVITRELSLVLDATENGRSNLSGASCAANGVAALEDRYDQDLTKRHLSFILYELGFR